MAKNLAAAHAFGTLAVLMPELSHLLVVSVEDADDPRAWSGTPYSLLRELRAQVPQVSFFRPSPPVRAPLDVLRRVLHGGKPPRYPLWMTAATLKRQAAEVRAEIERLRPDAVLSISSQCLARLDLAGLGSATPPTLLFSDAPWLAWKQAYAGFTEMPVRWRQFSAEEAAAACRATGLIFWSDWAVDAAVDLYASDRCPAATIRAKAHAVPMGANHVPALTTAEVLAAAQARPAGRLDLLFVGKDWERKGGPLAVEVARELYRANVPVTLHIVGSRPELPAEASAYTHVHGLLSAADPEQSARLRALMLNSHFLLVPTRAECFGLAFGEAQAFALPPVSRRIHAVPSVVEDGVTGLLLAPEASAAEYAERILAMLRAPGAYMAMARAGRERYERVLNWPAAVRAIVRIITEQLP